MGATLEEVMAEIGYGDVRVFEREKEQIVLQASEKIARIAKEAELAKMEKAQIEEEKAQIEEEKAQTEEEKAQLLEAYTKLKKNHLDAALDMLLHGTPVELISKWTSLPENEVQRLKADIDVSIQA